ncbi:MAG TPA: lysozyme [Mycobacteriales bacterium]|nr:lysozyme [Mycobacteriales bacterium]
MPEHRTLPPRRQLLRFGAVAAVAAIIPLAISAAASAQTTPTATTHASSTPGFEPNSGTVPAGYHPREDYLGSQVAKHTKAATNILIQPDATLLKGLDVSGYQTGINWTTVAANGAKFAYVKATENTNYTNPQFSNEYSGSYNAGLMHGAYHFAIPNGPSAVAQADYFVAHGGSWSKDGRTLPPMLDIEYNPYGATCYGLSQSAMVSWISAFINEVHAKTTRWATIYSNLDWWTTCTGNSGAFTGNDPLFVARYASTVGTLPGGWGFWTFWQYADSGTFPGDQDYFNGDASRLLALANG